MTEPIERIKFAREKICDELIWIRQMPETDKFNGAIYAFTKALKFLDYQTFYSVRNRKPKIKKR